MMFSAKDNEFPYTFESTYPAFDAEKWSSIWRENYQGKTTEAKEVEGFLKKNYKDFKYVPWATMNRLMLMQDPNSNVEVELNEDGTPLFSGSHSVKTESGYTEKETRIFKNTRIDGAVHFVRVSCLFLGKHFREVYPVQNKAYGADKLVDQNDVNKAIQRAKAKVISLATGIAFRLYEDGDLQFDDTVEKTAKPTPKKSKATITHTPAEVAKEEDTPTLDKVEDKGGVEELVSFIHGNQELKEAIKKVNASLAKKFSFTVSIDEAKESLREKLSQVNSPDTMLKALKNMLK